MTVKELLTACTSNLRKVAIFTDDNEEILEPRNEVINILNNPFYEYILTANVVAWNVEADRILYIRTDYKEA